MLSVAGRNRVMDGHAFMLEGHVQWQSEHPATIDPRGQWIPWANMHKVEGPQVAVGNVQKNTDKKSPGPKRQRPENSVFPFPPPYCFIPPYSSQIVANMSAARNHVEDSSISANQKPNLNVQSEKNPPFYGEFDLQSCDDSKAPENGPTVSMTLAHSSISQNKSSSNLPPAPRFKPVENILRSCSVDSESMPPPSPDQWQGGGQRGSFSSMACGSPVSRIQTPLGTSSGRGGNVGWTPFAKSCGSGPDDSTRQADGDDPFGLCRYTPTHSLFIGLDNMDSGGSGGLVSGSGGYWTPTPPMGADLSMSRQGRFLSSPAFGSGNSAGNDSGGPGLPSGQLFSQGGGGSNAVTGSESSSRCASQALSSHSRSCGDFQEFDIDRPSPQLVDGGSSGAHHQQAPGVWRSLADMPSRMVNSRPGEEASHHGARLGVHVAEGGGRGKPRGGGAGLRSHPSISKVRQRQQLPGLQLGRQGLHGRSVVRPDEAGLGGSSEGTEDDGRGQGARGERRAAKYKGVTWDRVKKMWRVRLCLVGGSRQHVGYFADEDEGASAYLTALQSAKAQGLHVRCEG